MEQYDYDKIILKQANKRSCKVINMVDIEKVDLNNMKAMGILKHVLFCVGNGGDMYCLDTITTLEAVYDYLVDNNRIFNEST
jgi:hypothetical protein